MVKTRLTKICMAIFAPDERLPSSATLDDDDDDDDPDVGGFKLWRVTSPNKFKSPVSSTGLTTVNCFLNKLGLIILCLILHLIFIAVPNQMKRNKTQIATWFQEDDSFYQPATEQDNDDQKDDEKEEKVQFRTKFSGCHPPEPGLPSRETGIGASRRGCSFPALRFPLAYCWSFRIVCLLETLRCTFQMASLCGGESAPL